MDSRNEHNYSPQRPHTSPIYAHRLRVTIPSNDESSRPKSRHWTKHLASTGNQSIVIQKKTSSGRIARIHIHECPYSNERRSLSPSRHDTSRTCTGLKSYPKPLSPKKKFKLGMTSSVQRRCDSPVKSRILEIYKNFTPKMRNYKSINPKWNCG
jgi:hypothetical protein